MVYIQTDDHAGSVEFYNPSSAQDWFNQTLTSKDRPMTMSSVRSTAKVGRVVLFPSWLAHAVGQNNSDQDRISIAFNFW